MDVIWRLGPVSRAEIAEATGLTKPAISLAMQSLANRGLVREEAPRRGQRGQPSRPLSINGEAGFAAGVNFSHSYLELGVIDLAGRPLGQVRAPLAEPKAEAVSEVAARELRKLTGALSLDVTRLIGVGFSLPGDFYADGRMLASHAYFPDLRGKDLAPILSAGLPAPAFLENDGRASAIGERVVGHGRSLRTFMLVHIGHGMGGGLIIDGRPYSGAYGNAGLLGQYHPYGHPRPSGQDLLELLQSNGVECHDFDGLEALEDAALPLVRAWTTRAAAQLRESVPKVARFFGPEAVIIAGRLPPAILQALASGVDVEGALAQIDDLPSPRTLSSSLGSSAGVVGAACLPIFHNLLPEGQSKKQRP